MNDTWLEVYDKMMDVGWKWQPSGGKLSNFVCIHPSGKKPSNGGELGEDFVSSKFELKVYAYKHLGWKDKRVKKAVRVERLESSKRTRLTSTRARKSPRTTTS